MNHKAQEEYGEPWRVLDGQEGLVFANSDGYSDLCASFRRHWAYDPELRRREQTRAKRAAAAVNFCAGVPQAFLEANPGGMQEVIEAARNLVVSVRPGNLCESFMEPSVTYWSPAGQMVEQSLIEALRASLPKEPRS